MTDKPNPEIQTASAATQDVRHSYIFGRTFDYKKVYYTAVKGLAVFEGDIILGTVEEMERIRKDVEEPDPNLQRGCVIVGTRYLWRDAVIPYRVDPNLPDRQRVTDAINHLEANTHLRFRVRTNEADFVTFRDGNGCVSAVGRRGGEQFITIGNGCDWPRVVHEICHAAGLWHEQSREDRDTFVTVHWDNISEANRHNFNQHITDGDDVGSYDYGSIMHYGRRDFAVDSSRDTLTPTDASATIGQRTRLSAGDIAALNLLYPKTAVLEDTSTNAPAIVWKNQQFLLGWTGHGNSSLNFMSSTDGVTFNGRVTLGDSSPEEFALVGFNNKFVIAWIGTGNNRINIMQSSDGRNWGNKVTLGDASRSGPALAVFNNQLYLAWRGHGNNKLNVMRSSDGVNWGQKVTLGDTSTSGPALAALNTRLLLAWRGEGNNKLNVLSSTDGSSFGNKVTLNETTLSQPHLHARSGRAYLSWQGQTNNRLNVLVSTNGSHWGSKVTMNDTCIDGPVLTSTPSNLICAWTGTDTSHHLNTMRLNIV